MKRKDAVKIQNFHNRDEILQIFSSMQVINSVT